MKQTKKVIVVEATIVLVLCLVALAVLALPLIPPPQPSFVIQTDKGFQGDLFVAHVEVEPTDWRHACFSQYDRFVANFPSSLMVLNAKFHVTVENTSATQHYGIVTCKLITKGGQHEYNYTLADPTTAPLQPGQQTTVTLSNEFATTPFYGASQAKISVMACDKDGNYPKFDEFDNLITE